MTRPVAEPLIWAVAARTVALAVVICTAAMAASVVSRAGEPVEAVSSVTLGVAVVAGAVALIGAGVLALSRDRDVVLLSAAASMLVIVAVAATFSFGILVLPLAGITIALLARRAAGRHRLLGPLAAGGAMAAGVAALLVIWVQPPLVECHEHGVSVHARPWSDSGGASGTGSMPASGIGVTTGSIETPSGRYVYRCEGPTLVEFQRR